MKITIHISSETEPEAAVETGHGGAVPQSVFDNIEALATQLENAPSDDTPTYAIASELRGIATILGHIEAPKPPPPWRVNPDDMYKLADRIDTWLYNHKGIDLQVTLETLLREVETELRTAGADIEVRLPPRF